MDDSETPYNPLLRVVQDEIFPKPLTIPVKCILVGINIASIAIGAIYIKECPGEYLIPYYLIISGAACLVYLSLTCLPCGDGREPPRVSLAGCCAQSLMLLFLFAFFIAGNVWIYSLYHQPWDSPLSPKRCNRVLYLYAFWMITLCHLCFAALLVIYFCLLFCLCILNRSMFWESSIDRIPS